MLSKAKGDRQRTLMYLFAQLQKVLGLLNCPCLGASTVPSKHNTWVTRQLILILSTLRGMVWVTDGALHVGKIKVWIEPKV